VSGYLLVETSGGWAGPGCDRFVRDAVALRRAGQRVCLFLVQDGVLAGRAAAGQPAGRLAELLAELIAAGGQVWVDRWSLAARAVPASSLVPAATVVDMAAVAGEVLAPGTRVVWR
jgi:DsrE/DsrF-like family